MADLESLVCSAQGGRLVANLADRFGLSEEQIAAAIEALSPALAIGLNRAAEEPQIFEKTVNAMAGASRYAFFDDPEAAQSQDSVDMGRDLLNELFGSPSATGQVLQAAARVSGVRADILGQLLPILLSVLISGLTKSINSKGLGGLLGQLAGSGALGSILEQILAGGAARPAPEPEPAPRRGGLSGLLGALLGALFGGRRAPPPRGGTAQAGRPLDMDLDQRGSGPGGLSAGLDQAEVQQAIDEIKKTLQIGRSGGQPGSQSGSSDLETILGQILGKR